MMTFKDVFEDASGGQVPTNTVGSGNVEGAGVGDRGEPGVPKNRKRTEPLRRSEPR